MAVTVSYDQDCKMIISGVECSCGCQHHAIDKDIYIGKGLLPRIPSYIAKRGLGTHCVLVADDNTYRVAGAEVEKALTDAGFAVVACVIHREHDMLPDDLSCGEVLLSITRETDFLIAVGSGTVTDATRINAERTGLPFVSVGTAPSMDGYASAVAPLLHRGLKIQRPAVCPEIIVCDLDVLATAPMRLIAADIGNTGDYTLLVNKPISVSAQFFENYRFFPEGEIESLYWDGVGLGLQWKTRRIKGSVVDFALADPNNDGTKDLVVCLNTHPGALGLQNRKTVVVFYPLDLSMMDPKTAPALD